MLFTSKHKFYTPEQLLMNRFFKRFWLLPKEYEVEFGHGCRLQTKSNAFNVFCYHVCVFLIFICSSISFRVPAYGKQEVQFGHGKCV